MNLPERLTSWAQNEENIDGHYLEHGRDCLEAAKILEQQEKVTDLITDRVKWDRAYAEGYPDDYLGPEQGYSYVAEHIESMEDLITKVERFTLVVGTLLQTAEAAEDLSQMVVGATSLRAVRVALYDLINQSEVKK